MLLSQFIAQPFVYFGVDLWGIFILGTCFVSRDNKKKNSTILICSLFQTIKSCQDATSITALVSHFPMPVLVASTSVA